MCVCEQCACTYILGVYSGGGWRGGCCWLPIRQREGRTVVSTARTIRAQSAARRGPWWHVVRACLVVTIVIRTGFGVWPTCGAPVIVSTTLQLQQYTIIIVSRNIWLYECCVYGETI